MDEDPVVLYHFRDHLDRIERLGEGRRYNINNIYFTTPIRHIHGVETYGFNFYSKNNILSIITDTKYFDGLEKFYPGNILILNVVLLKPKNDILHLSMEDAERIIERNKPELTVLTHFGMTMIKAKPWELAEELTEKLGVKVIAARDGMELSI